MNRRIVLGDVAQRARVPEMLASPVLDGHDCVRTAAGTGGRVADNARTIGFISDTIASSPFAGDMINGAVDEARANSCGMLIVETHGDPTFERASVEGMLDRRVDGVIYAAMSTRRVASFTPSGACPVVLLNCLADEQRAPMVVPDEFNAGRDAARLLIEAGHDDGIYVIGGHHKTRRTPHGVYAGWERMRGIKHAMHRAGLKLAGVAECSWNGSRHGYWAVRTLLGASHRPQALICCNDRLAMGAYQALAEAGFTVGGDVSVVSFDDSHLAAWLRPRLTSIALPHYDLGQAAVRALLGNTPAASFISIPMRVADRDSVRGSARLRTSLLR